MFGKSKTEIAKITVSTVIKYSTSFTVGAIIHAVCPTTSNAQKAKMMIGSYAIGAMVADRVGAYTETQIDEVIDAIDKIKNAENIEVISPEE
jgi:hypothetical protein